MRIAQSAKPRPKALALSLMLVVAAVILPTSFGAARGEEGTPEQRRACRPDVVRHCRGMHDSGAIELCLRANMQELRPACRHVFGGA
jgi:hypothetical protein